MTGSSQVCRIYNFFILSISVELENIKNIACQKDLMPEQSKSKKCSFLRDSPLQADGDCASVLCYHRAPLGIAIVKPNYVTTETRELSLIFISSVDIFVIRRLTH